MRDWDDYSMDRMVDTAAGALVAVVVGVVLALLAIGCTTPPRRPVVLPPVVVTPPIEQPPVEPPPTPTPTPPPAPAGPVITARDGRFFDGTGARLVPRWKSLLIALTKTPAQQAVILDQVVANGFAGVRVFSGALTWAGQTPESAREALPAFLDRAAARGLVVEVTGLTDTASGYDAREHIRLLAGILANRFGVVFELMNEIGHPTQDATITPGVLRAWGQELVAPLGIPWAVGASEVDEPCPPDPWDRERPAACRGYGEHEYPAAGGSYNTAHLERGRDFWNQFRRVRELYAIPALNNEPLGCAEPGTPGQRYYDPAMAYVLGVLDRAFGVGGVHHSQSGLLAELPGPVQQACELAYVAGHRDVDAVLPGVVGQYLNVGHGGSPLSGARFVDGGGADGVVRAYSFVDGANRGVTVLVGLRGDAALTWANGWEIVRTVGSRTAHDGRQIVVLEIRR